MNVVKAFILLLIVLSLTMGISTPSRADVMLSATVNELSFTLRPSAVFTMDDWLSNPGMFTLTIHNAGGTKTVTQLVIGFSMFNPVFGNIVEGKMNVVGDPAGPQSKFFIPQLAPTDPPYVINNTMLDQSTKQVESVGGFSDRFQDEVTRIGILPEGSYSFRFWIDSNNSFYDDGTHVEADQIDESIDIKSPEPPELLEPNQNADDVRALPRFAWQRPLVTDFSRLSSSSRITISYTLKLWKMFDNDGTVLDQETAITRFPIWETHIEPIEGQITATDIDFNSGESREDLVSGRSYAWQVQAFDGTGRPISSTNDGKSDVWSFTVDYTPLTINQPIMFYPLRFNWSPAQTGGSVVLYDVFIADNIDFTSAYFDKGMVTTNYTYPGSAPQLTFGTGYYIKIQATDDAGLPLGEPEIETFTLPTLEVNLSAPPDGEEVATITPTFRWQGDADHHMVTVFDTESEWTTDSGGLEGNSWVYDGEDFKPGVTYSWNVTPSNNQGDPLGEPSDSWTFMLPPPEQMTLMSPLNARIDTVFPIFSWNTYSQATGDNVVYRIIVSDENGSLIHSADVPSTSYTYPSDATGLLYGKKYTWSVGAMAGGSDVGLRSNDAWFITPFVETEGEDVTITEVESAIKMVLADYPQFQKYEEMILAGITGPDGSVSPTQLMDFIDKFTIVNVSAK
ncbi:hypothetical protein ACFL47_03970 [Candidatus Latescibacterota bacterium]